MDGDRDRDEFAEKMISALRRAGQSGTLAYDAQQFRVVTGSSSFLNLHNAFDEWQKASRLRRGEVLRRWAAALASTHETPESVDEARPNLLPRVRDIESFKIMELQFALRRNGEGAPQTYLPLNDYLGIEIVYDWPTTISSVAPEKMQAWGMSIEEAVRTARANLRERTPGAFTRLEAGVFVSQRGDTYDAARLLLTELITRLEVRGDPVVLLPGRDHLLVTGTDDPAGLERIAAIAEPMLNEPRYITGRAFVWRDGAWHGYSPPPDHPQHERFRRLAQITEARAYGEQKAALDEHHQATNNDVYVSGVKLMATQESEVLTSVTTWTRGVHALLPKADVVTFVQLDETGTDHRFWRVPWDQAMTMMGDAMEPQGLRPERWHVSETVFPSAEQLAPYNNG